MSQRVDRGALIPSRVIIGGSSSTDAGYELRDKTRLRPDEAHLEGIEGLVIQHQGAPQVEVGHNKVRPVDPVRKGDKLGWAAQLGDLTEVKRLLKKGADPNTRNRGSGITPLGVAVERGHAEVVGTLLAAKADANAATVDGVTPLLIASQFSQRVCVKQLLEVRATVDDHDAINGLTALMYAVTTQQTDIIDLLLDASASLSKMSRSGKSALHLAAAEGRERAVQALCAREGGIDVTQRDATGKTALGLALANGHDGCAELLRAPSQEQGLEEEEERRRATAYTRADADAYRQRLVQALDAGDVSGESLCPQPHFTASPSHLSPHPRAHHYPNPLPSQYH